MVFILFRRFVAPENKDLQQEIAQGRNKATFLETTLKIKARFEPLHDGSETWRTNVSGTYIQNTIIN